MKKTAKYDTKKLIKKKNTRQTESKKIRLNKFLANAGICSRRDADKFIEAGVVTVNGIGVVEMGYKVSQSDIIRFNDQKVNCDALRYVLLNKPKNYSGRGDNSKKTPSVLSLINSACKERIFPIERLNKIETGLLLFTNDNDLAKKLTNKNKKIKSIYHITLKKKLSQSDLEKIRAGIFINNKKHQVDSISYILKKDKNEVGIESHQVGLKHIKEIFTTLNHQITRVDRVFFGGLTKKNLPRKHYRHLNQKEITILQRL